MVVNFKPAVLANASEQKVFEHMKPMREHDQDQDRVGDTFWTKDDVLFEDGVKYSLECGGEFGIFECSGDNYEKGSHTKTEQWKLKGGNISQFRYGDIDKDGDMDIAFKLTNGAIYVFHNSRGDVPTLPKPEEPVQAIPKPEKPAIVTPEPKMEKKPAGGCGCSLGSRY